MRKGHRQLRPEPAASRDQGPELAKHVPFSLSPCPTLVQNLCLPPAQTTVTALPWASRHLPPPSRQPPHPGATIPALKTEPGQVAPPPQALLEPPLARSGLLGGRRACRRPDPAPSPLGSSRAHHKKRSRSPTRVPGPSHALFPLTDTSPPFSGSFR